MAQRDLRISAKFLEDAREAIDTSEEKSLSLLSEARSVGIIPAITGVEGKDEVLELLRGTLRWKPQSVPQDTSDDISRLEERIADLRQERRDLQTRADSARQFSKPANKEIGFSQSERFPETRPRESGNGLSLRRTSVWGLPLLPHS